MRRFTESFSVFPKFREHFAVKAMPNPYMLKILAEEGCGADCSSLPELMLSDLAGIEGESVIFTSNETPAPEFQYAYEHGNLINLDDITHIDFLKNMEIIVKEKLHYTTLNIIFTVSFLEKKEVITFFLDLLR